MCIRDRVSWEIRSIKEQLICKQNERKTKLENAFKHWNHNTVSKENLSNLEVKISKYDDEILELETELERQTNKESTEKKERKAKWTERITKVSSLDVDYDTEDEEVEVLHYSEKLCLENKGSYILLKQIEDAYKKSIIISFIQGAINLINDCKSKDTTELLWSGLALWRDLELEDSYLTNLPSVLNKGHFGNIDWLIYDDYHIKLPYPYGCNFKVVEFDGGQEFEDLMKIIQTKYLITNKPPTK